MISTKSRCGWPYFSIPSYSRRKLVHLHIFTIFIRRLKDPILNHRSGLSFTSYDGNQGEGNPLLRKAVENLSLVVTATR